MAWTFVLTTESGTDSVNLNDGTNYQVLPNGFESPPPQQLTSYSGLNLHRHGEDLLLRTYGNRNVTLRLTISGTNASTLGQKVIDVWNLLRMAEEYAKEGMGTRVQLRYQWEGQTGTYLFNVLEGDFNPGPGLHSPYLLKGTRIRDAQLNLVCEPFVTQPSETLQNWLKDPSFEIAGSALADWSSTLGTATGTRVTSNTKYGTASLRVVKGTAAGVNTADYLQAFTSPGTAAFSASVWGTIVGSNDARLLLIWRDSAGAQVGSNTATATSGTFQLTITNAAPPASAGTGTLQCILRQVGFDGSTGTIYWDGGFLTTATALPKAWVSGRDVVNHFDDNGQAHINYLDLYDVPGDVAAPLQVKVLENEAHAEIWAGARHAGRTTATAIILEGESFTSTIGSGWVVSAPATVSNGSVGYYSVFADFSATAAATPQVVMRNIGIPPLGQFRVLGVVRSNFLPATSTAYLGLGYQYGGVTVDPSTTAHYQALTSTAYAIVDMGVVTIPPLQTPQAGTVGTFGLRVASYKSSAVNQTYYLDYVMLLPVDQGGIYGSKTSAADNLWLDSYSQPQGVYRVSTADVVQSFPPGQQGSPPLGHPKGSRVYFAFGSATSSIGHGATVSVSYTPRWLMVGT